MSARIPSPAPAVAPAGEGKYLALRLTEPQVGPAPLWELLFERQTIGRGARCTIQVKRDRIGGMHATIFRDEHTGEYSIEPDAGAPASFLNSQRFGRRTPLNDGDSLVLGAIIFRVFRAPELSPAQLDEARRAKSSDVVFADWLESVGRVDEAAWLRARRGKSKELATLAARLSTAERALLARAPIQRCAKLNCPGDWSRLELTAQARVRTCAECRAVVPFCTRAQEATIDLKPCVIE
ncbi:MAG: FHA domain-containing protein [Archangium sp.]|nr:FHA domain-containing protein [Archangium sp.]